MHGEALSAIDRLDANGHECVIVPQVIYEYWVVATRPLENNGPGMTVATANAAISQWTAGSLAAEKDQPEGLIIRFRGAAVNKTR